MPLPFEISNPGIGGVQELTTSELTFIQGLAGLSYTDGDILIYNSGLTNLAIGTEGQTLTVSAGGFPEWTTASAGLSNVVEDTTPQLGGELDAQGNNIIDLGNVTFQTGASGGTLRTGTSAADKFQLQAYDVNDTTYRMLIEADAGNTVVLQIIGDYLAIEDATDTTKHVEWDISGATGSTATTLTFAQTAARTITFPDATDTLVGKATTDTLTNKTFDANGTGNSLSNVEVADLAASAIVTEAEGLNSSDNDTSIPTTAAVKDYADSLGGVGGSTGSTDNAIIRANGTGGSTVQSSTAVLSDTGDLTIYDATNDGNPVIAYGASATERLTITPTYDTGAQTLDYVEFATAAASATADKGEFRFNVDGTLVTTIDDGGLEIKASGSLSFGAVDILTDSAGTTTLSNIDAIDDTTETTIESAIDTLANLTSIQGVTVTLADAGANAIFGWDDAAGAYENLTKSEVQGILGLETTSTDNAVVRFDSTGGNTQNSGVTVSDTDVVGGVTQLNVDNLRLDGNTLSSTDSNGHINLTPDGTGIVKGELKRFMVRLIAAGTSLAIDTTVGGDYRISNRAITVKAVGAYVDTAAATGSNLLTVDIHEAGTTIMTTNKITIDVGEKTSTSATTAPAVTDTAIAADAIITFDIDQVNETTPAKGLVVWIDYVYA